MSQLSFLCLSLAPNLRCVGFTLRQFEALVIPPVIEVVISLLFIYLYSGPDRLAQILLVADAALYFTWALLDMLSHVVPAARTSLSLFKTLDFLVGAVSFTPILVYSLYLYRLSFRDFIPTLPRKLQPYLEISLPILLAMAVVINGVSSFVGIRFGIFSNQFLVIEFPHDSESLWRSLSWSSLALYTIIQFLFFLLSFSRLSRAFLGQRRIELTNSDEHHYFRGIAWITAGIIVGVTETLSGFAQASFGLVLARRILRLSARVVLMYGLLKGLDVAESFETLTDELRSVSHISRRISRLLGVNSQRRDVFRRISQSYPEQAQADKRPRAKKQPRDQRVTVHCEKGQAPFLQIRFSTSDFPAQSMFADMAQNGRRSLSGLITGRAGAGSRAQQRGPDVSDDIAAARSTLLDTPRAKSALVPMDSDHHEPPDWIRPPERCHTREGSGGAVSDRLSIVRELERKFPNLPPRVTGKYRGSILGDNYEEDPFPIVGVSRQSSLRGGAPNSSEEGGNSAALSSSGSIKRKPAPPLLENILHISGRRKHPVSTWGGLAQKVVNQPANSPVAPNTPSEDTMLNNPDSLLTGEHGTPRSRRRTARDIIKMASRPVSDASIRSAEWLASASSLWPTRTPFTATDIEMYRRGNMGPGSAHHKSRIGEAALLGEQPFPKSGRSVDGVGAHSKLTRSHTISRISVGKITLQTGPILTHTELESGCEQVPSSHGSVIVNDTQSIQATVIPAQQEIEPEYPSE